MTDQKAYQEYIQRRYNAFCKTVIRCAALDKILKLKRQWERQVSRKHRLGGLEPQRVHGQGEHF